MIICYSGTGNSRYAADMLCELLEDEICDAFPYIREGKKLLLKSEKPWVVVCPTYAWRLPKMVEKLLQEADLQGSKDIYFIMSCGSDIGASGQYNAELCKVKGLQYCGTLELSMPENYIAMFDTPTIERCKEMIAAVKPILRQTATQIAAGKALQDNKINFLDKLKSGPVNKGFTQYHVKPKLFTCSNSCIACNKCATDCPLNNIRLVEGKPVWGDSCTHCMACICGCPTEAIEYGKISRGKRRYQAPKYKA